MIVVSTARLGASITVSLGRSESADRPHVSKRSPRLYVQVSVGGRPLHSWRSVRAAGLVSLAHAIASALSATYGEAWPASTEEIEQTPRPRFDRRELQRLLSAPQGDQ